MTFTFSRKWKLFGLLVLISGLISLAVLKWWPEYKGLAWLYVYSIPSHVYISFLPHEPVLLYVGKLYNIVLVVTAATLGTLVAGFIDYETLGPALKHKRIQTLYHDKKFYHRAVDLFYKAPFCAIFVAALTPIPYYPIKLLSIASDYPEGKYLFALTLGRIPRYFLLTYAGIAFDIPNWVLILFFVALLLIAFARQGIEFAKRAATGTFRKKSEGVQDKIFK